MKRLRQYLTLGVTIGPLPVNLMDGQIADAVPVMANFNWIVSQVNSNAGAGLVPVYKTTAQLIANSATPVVDNTLFFNAVAGTYVFKVHIGFISLASNGFQFQMGGTAPISVTRYFYNGVWDSGSGAAPQSGLIVGNSWPAGPGFLPGGSTNGFVVIDGFVTTTGTGTVGFAWSQAVSGANNAQVAAGSYLEYALN